MSKNNLPNGILTLQGGEGDMVLTTRPKLTWRRLPVREECLHPSLLHRLHYSKLSPLILQATLVSKIEIKLYYF